MNGWIGVDLDGTLAEYDGWHVDGSIGKPIPAMVERVKAWIAEGKDVRIFTARVWPIGTVVFESQFPGHHEFDNRLHQAAEQQLKIQAWCEQHLGVILPVTCVKDYDMIVLYDDRAVQVELNTGRLIGVAE